MNLDLLADILGPLVWPLCFLFVMLVLIRQLYQDVRPIFIAVRDGVAVQAKSNAPAYAICMLFGISASASSFIDTFGQLTAENLRVLSWHQYATLWVKCLNPFIVAVLAYATQNKFNRPAGSAGTNPPFVTPAQ